MTIPLLNVSNLSVEFRTRHGMVRALEGINFQVNRCEIIGIVGESGSGKSVLAYTLLRILESSARVTSGTAIFNGLDLIAASENDLADIRGRELSMIFQSPRSALNPIRRVGQQIEDVLRRHSAIPSDQLQKRAMACLTKVQIADPERRYHAYPFELSGGQCQRIMIAMALAPEPALLLADEPTTGLDVTTQAVVMNLIRELVQKNRMAAIFITHDLALAAQFCDRLIVMHAGHIVESAPTQTLFQKPRHPYTARLIGATPHNANSIQQLITIPGNLPDLRRSNLPACRFAERCERKREECDKSLVLRYYENRAERFPTFLPSPSGRGDGGEGNSHGAPTFIIEGGDNRHGCSLNNQHAVACHYPL